MRTRYTVDILAGVAAPVSDRVLPARERGRTTGPAADRLRWLDALRGVAVIAVVVEHLSYLVFRELRAGVIVPWFDVGKYGVLVFFLVSGYIVPASLERHGSVRRFWVSRAFRLYPMLCVAVGIIMVLGVMGVTPLDARLSHDLPTVLMAHGTFLQDLLGVQNSLNVLWTLSYEMVFYLSITALFICRLHRRSADIALGLGIGSLFLATLMPAVMLSRDPASVRLVVVAAVAVLAGGIACATASAQRLRLVGAVLLGGLAAILMLFNQRAGMWEGLVILATMFTGTTLYRVEHGQVGRAKGLGVAAAVWAMALGSGIWHFAQWTRVDGAAERYFQQSWVVAVLLAGVTFAAGWLLRNRRMPRPLLWVGVVSYSVYLMHTVVLSVFHYLFDGSREDLSLVAQAGVAGVFFAFLFLVTWATHRFIEAPGQRVGRQVARRVATPYRSSVPAAARRLET